MTDHLDRRELLKAAVRRIEELESRQRRLSEPLAVVGLGCRFPAGAATPDAFWEVLRSGVDVITEVPRERWDVNGYFDADPDAPGKSYSRYGGFLDDVAGFDADLFGIAPREAAYMDPQQRILLEVVWEAFERAGIAPTTLLASPTGVFIGMATSDYSHMQWEGGTDGIADAYFGSGVSPSVAAGRIAYAFGLRGPCMTIDTACSSSLVALHLAAQSLRAGECRMAVAGGVNLMLSPGGHIATSKGRMLSPGGRCRTFDASADGYVRSEGCGIVILKRLSDALADDNPVLAVVRGTAINHDGRSGGLTAPSGLAQEDVIRQALAASGAEPAQIAYVETHGTGTSLGDPIEVQALGAVQRQRSHDDPLLIASVKSNIGHLEAAAGIAGFIKVVLALQHEQLPPHLHFDRPNPHIPWHELPVAVVTTATPWPLRDGRRLAGVSSFGFSGTNAHVIVEGAPLRRVDLADMPVRPAHVLALSARSTAGLKAVAARHIAMLDADTECALADISFSVNTGRAHLETRLAALCSSRDELRHALEAYVKGAEAPGLICGRAKKSGTQPVFLFTGQGAQYPGMGRQLFDTHRGFRRAMEECQEILRDRLDRLLLDILYPQGGDKEQASAVLRRTEFAQPALFAVEWALAQLYRSWGVEPAAVLGHSVGEYVAACVAGVLPLRDALTLVAERGRLMQSLAEGGAMHAVFASADEIHETLADFRSTVSIAAVNSIASVVISGVEEDLATIVAALGRRGIVSKPLNVSHAFHSPLLDPVLPALERAAAGMTLAEPQIDLVSNLTGNFARAGELTSPRYWRQHARQPVQFAAGLSALRQRGHDVFVEIGPHPVLIGMCRADGGDGRQEQYLPTLRRDQDDWPSLLTTLAALHVRGTHVDWAAFDAEYGRQRVPVPTYAFQRERFWFPQRQKTRAQTADVRDTHPLLGRRLRSPRLSDEIFEVTLAADAPAFLADHRILGNTIVPAAAYLEMATAAAQMVCTEAGAHGVELVIRSPLTLDAGPRTVQTIVSHGAPDVTFEICSTAGGVAGGEWTTHASGTITPAPTSPPAGGVESLSGTNLAAWAADAYYERLRDAGADYGPSFRGLQEIRSGLNCATGTIACEAIEHDSAGYALHPALLDAAFQLAGAALLGQGREGDDVIYMPIGVANYSAARRPAGPLHVEVRVRPTSDMATSFSCDVRLDDHAGLVATIERLQFKKADVAVLRASTRTARRDWIYQVAWEPVGAPGDVAPGSRPRGTWLVLADRGGCAESLIADLRRDGTVVVMRADDVDDGDRIAAAVQEASLDGPLVGAIHLWNLDLAADADLSEAEATGCVSALHLAQALIEHGRGAHLTIATRGAQHAGGQASVNAAQSPVWGLARVLSSEAPELQVRIVDLDPETDAAAQAGLLVEDLSTGRRDEDQVAIRAGRRLVPRLVRGDITSADDEALSAPETGTFALEITQRGVLDRLHLGAFAAGTPRPREVQIRIAATGLNFRDVLNALDMYPGDPGPLGGEVSGTVEAVGSEVSRFSVGDEVMALVPRGYCTLVNTPEDLVWPRPASMTALEAATIPLVFQTAQYALHHVAQMKPGDRVLIHAASGGVGLAAVQLAQRAGAEIFATAGSVSKRALLRSRGIRHVMSSRTLEFRDEFRVATGGDGVDIVLNSLAGEFIPASLELLRCGGWFLELGKTDVWTPERADAVAPGVRYVPVYLGTVCAERPEQIRTMYGELMPAFTRGELRPLPRVVFPVDRAGSAFRFMAQARHVGKIVLSQRLSAPRGHVRRNATYVITGAFGSLGLAVARWMAGQGAGRLLLIGRRAPSDDVLTAITEIQRTVDVRIATLDVADRTLLEAAIREACTTDAPLRGVIHAAGVLDDGVVAQQTGERFARVMRPKVRGAWNLHEITRELDLDFFVLFSAGAGLFGAQGQSNYAAANTFLDALAHHRRLRGLPALSVNWGAWTGGGMAAGVDDRQRARWADHGIGLVDPETGMALLRALLDSGVGQAAVLPIDWAKFGAAQGGRIPPLVSTLVQQTSQPAHGTPGERDDAATFPRQLRSVAPGEQCEVLARYVTGQIAAVLGRSSASLPGDRGFAELGMDSLMSVELSNRLKRSLKLPIPATVAFEYPTIATLTVYLGSLLGLDADRLSTGTSREAEPASGLLRDIARLNEDEVERTLADALEQAGY